MKRLSLLGLALLAACGGAPPPPDWQLRTASALDEFRDGFLQGRPVAADRAYARAIAAVADTGEPALADRAALVRCAVASAAAAFDGCPAPPAVSPRNAEDEAYARFLSGTWDGMARDALPAAYRPVAGAGSVEKRNAAMIAVADPLSRLVAAGVLLRRAEISPEGIGAAIDTASKQGWRRPLLAWLGIAERLANERGDAEAAARFRARIAFVESARPE